LQPKFFQVLHVVFAFRGVFHDPLRELRPDALKLLLSVRLDTLGTQFLPSGIKSAREIVQCVWLEGKLTFGEAFDVLPIGGGSTKLSVPVTNTPIDFIILLLAGGDSEPLVRGSGSA
jgi:hypothetical protein